MPNGKRSRKTRSRRPRATKGMPSCAEWFVREVLPLLPRPKLPRTRSARHLRNATIEVLEAVRVLIDEAIQKLQQARAAELKRIRVEG